MTNTQLLSSKSMAPLLRLPGELRNKIYEYTLSEEKGVVYHEDSRKVGWLCLHTSGGSSELVSTVAEGDGTFIAENKLSRGSLRGLNHTITTSTQGVPGLVCIREYVVANQLQFVNHQIRYDTRALSFRYNDLTILDTLMHGTRVFQSLSKRQTSWLRKVTIRAKDGWDKTPNTGVVGSDSGWDDFAQAYPRLTVHIHNPYARIGSRIFLMTGTYFQYCWRGNTSFLRRLSRDTGTQQILAGMIDMINSNLAKPPPSIKIFPWEAIFDEEVFREACVTTDFLARFLSTRPYFDIEVLVAMARGWCMNGF